MSASQKVSTPTVIASPRRSNLYFRLRQSLGSLAMTSHSIFGGDVLAAYHAFGMKLKTEYHKACFLQKRA